MDGEMIAYVIGAVVLIGAFGWFFYYVFVGVGFSPAEVDDVCRPVSWEGDGCYCDVPEGGECERSELIAVCRLNGEIRGLCTILDSPLGDEKCEC